MPFEFVKQKIDGVYIVKPKMFGDERGYFIETFKESEFRRNGIDVEFRQDNQSYSTRGVLRGLHFQKGSYAQGKLVRVVAGKIFDVGVDLREESRTYGQYISAILTEDGKEMLWLPEGFAHGFLALEDSIVLYKATNEYNKESEVGLMWNDPNVAIKWPFMPSEVSEKDKKWPSFSALQR